MKQRNVLLKQVQRNEGCHLAESGVDGFAARFDVGEGPWSGPWSRTLPLCPEPWTVLE